MKSAAPNSTGRQIEKKAANLIKTALTSNGESRFILLRRVAAAQIHAEIPSGASRFPPLLIRAQRVQHPADDLV